MVRDPAAAHRFYGALFGWEFRSGPRQLGPYERALLDGREVAGIGRLPAGSGLPVAWTPYFAAENADRLAETVRACGGTVGVGPLDSPHAGRMALAIDPTGAVFGLWQAAEHRGFAVTGVAGAQSWVELVTRDTASVGPFYRRVFGFTAEPVVSADLDHLTLFLDGRPVAALHGVGGALSHEQGPRWLTYFEVDDVPESAARVASLGGEVLRAPREGPLGPQATVADPEGAVFVLVRTRG
ncbi:VOC family protein [Streptomyces sp. NPDC007088]|uniref:VOC family protein n=1 Tax=Streptomyces sp. NPDC007088 TaxID=3364773 RepID=UPI00369370A9